MRVTFVSRSWPSNERSGVTLAAAEHVSMLIDAGHDVSIVGSCSTVLDEQLPVFARYYVPAQGSGALYSPPRINLGLLESVLLLSKPDLIVVEAWQTALTDAAVDIAYRLGFPLLMVSHGVAVHSFTKRPIDLLRAFGWIYYRIHFLPQRISRLSALTTLDELATSKRFYDRDIAIRLGIPVVSLVNSAVNWRAESPERAQRKLQVLVVGYYSPIKNQLGALETMKGLPEYIQFRFVGRRSGSYFDTCVKRASQLGLSSRVIYCEDDECDLAEEVAYSLAILSTSVTEALPIILLEAMASGTPFVATPVGAVSSLKAGILAGDTQSQRNAILALLNDNMLWNRLSYEGRCQFQLRFTRKQVQKNLLHAVSVVMKAEQR